MFGLAALGVTYFWRQAHESQPSWKMAKVDRGPIVMTISATGTVEPEEVVDIGAQVAGQVKNLGTDPRDPKKSVDYTTPVEEGTVLAQIDDSLYVSDVDQARATVEGSKASLQRSQADVNQLRAKLTQAERDWARAQQLKSQPGAITEQDYDMFQANYESAKANLSVGEAAVIVAQRAVSQAEAVLRKAERNLSYCTIRSPVKGVIVDRRVNVGQTVVSSLNAPSLFLIAKDLKRLQVWVSVNEADIGQIHQGQPATFTVDAYPGRVFRGEVGKIRLNAAMTQNVVTYTVEVNTDNSDEKLLPYLTANLQFEVGRRDDVLRVPTAALRFFPQSGQVAPDVRERAEGSPKAKAKADGPADGGERGTLWTLDGKFLRPIHVRVGASDGIMTEVSGEGVTEGMQVIIGENRSAAAGGGGGNPFAPKLFGGKSS